MPAALPEALSLPAEPELMEPSFPRAAALELSLFLSARAAT